MKPKLILITKDFPYGNSEDSFVKLEYPYLCQKFDVKVIASENKKKTAIAGIKSDFVTIDANLFTKMFSFIHFLCEKDCYKELYSIIKLKKNVLQRVYRALMFGTAAETFYIRIKKKIDLNLKSNCILYFYWFDYKCFGITMHKNKFPNVKIIARTHGYDLYDERELYGKQFFKPQMDENINRLIFASNYAKKYYLNRYNIQDSIKYPVYRLGVKKQEITIDKKKEQYKQDLPFLLLSCSHAINLKRIELIIEGLSFIEEKIMWVHIGDGNQIDNLKKLAQQKIGEKRNINFQFLGAYSNSEVINFYKKNYVSCFITTTETEGGAPVSIQEALSFGIPVIVTKIAELPLMVNGNGIILSARPSREEVGEAVRKIQKIYGKDEYWDMCRQSLNKYEEMFNESKNYPEMVKNLESL